MSLVNNNFTNSRLDLEIYVMGEMKLEFMTFLGECFKENFIETLSWGNFRRFQLVISDKNSWLNVHFIHLKNEVNADILINSFKIYEKRNFTLLLYNPNDQKNEKQIDSLYESLILERNKFYEGILNEDQVNKNLKKFTSDTNFKNLKINSTDLIKNLRFLTENEGQNLIYKIGFYPNLVNKKTKNLKKHDSNNLYELNNEIFQIKDEEPTDFSGLMNFILKENFAKFRVDDSNQNIKNFFEVINFNPKTKPKQKTKKADNKMQYFVKVIDWLIVIYIISCFYKFMIVEAN
jgi:hypothetical protein